MSKPEFINYLERIILKGLLHAFWLFPIDNKKVTLLNELSFTYGDSLKYLDKYIHEKCGEKYKIVFPLKKNTVFHDNGDIIVTPGTFNYFRHVLTSKTIITNAGGVSYLPKRKGQRIISTWHGGGPYKKTSTDVYSSYWYKKQQMMNSDNTDYILSSCIFFSEVEAKSMGYNEEKIIPSGLPRNDILFGNHEEMRKKIRKYYSIPSDTKFILFAPTFRSKNNDFSNMRIVKDYVELDIDILIKTLKERFKCKWICGVRLHPKIKEVDVGSMNAINCTAYPDMQELLCCADAVISDYSSLIWDYSFTYRPIFLYAPDIDHYIKERGFYMPPSEWPYPIARNNEEMRRNILSFNEQEYINNIKKHHIAAGSFEKGNACTILMSLIEQNVDHSDS